MRPIMATIVVCVMATAAPAHAALSTADAGHAGRPLRWTVDAQLRLDPYLDYRAVRAQVSGGTVTLTGAVLTDFEKRRAAAGAGAVPGVTAVRNKIEVVRSSPGAESDLALRVRARLFQERSLTVTALDIETQPADTIILLGIVPTAARKARVGRAAAAVPGVAHVDNLLEVEPAE